jgi:hypothetical protein
MARSRRKLKKVGSSSRGATGRRIENPPSDQTKPMSVGGSCPVLQSSSGCIGGGGRPISQRSLLLMPRLLPPPSSI